MCLFFCFILTLSSSFSFFFFNDTATTEIYTLSLHDALPISTLVSFCSPRRTGWLRTWSASRSEEHTSELQSLTNLVCRLLLEKKKKRKQKTQKAQTHKQRQARTKQQKANKHTTYLEIEERRH